MTTSADHALREALVCHHVDKWDYDGTDFRRRARLLAAMWRQDHGYPMGLHHGKPLGSRLLMPDAQQRGWNFLTPAIHHLAREYAEGPRRERGALLRPDRLYSDLLSSQPMCFNLFGGLALDLNKATAFGRAVWPGRVDRVVDIKFEHSPGRGDPRYLNNGTAFDVFIEHTVPGGGLGFIGVETKYHENMLDPVPRQFKERYIEIAAASGVLSTTDRQRLWLVGTWQVWLDHMLAAATLLAHSDRWRCGLSVLLYPVENLQARDAGQSYMALLRDNARSSLPADRVSQFDTRTLEEVVHAASEALSDPWVSAFRSRYLGFERLVPIIGSRQLAAANEVLVTD